MSLRNAPSRILRYSAMMSTVACMLTLCRSDSGGGVASESAINASKQRTPPTGDICVAQSRIESDSFFAMSIVSEKLLMPISVNLGKTKQAIAPTKP